MLKELKGNAEKALLSFFKESLGDGYVIKVNWGIPMTYIDVTFKNEKEEISWSFSLNQETEDYGIGIKAVNFVDGKEVPVFGSVSREILVFILGNALRISNEVLNPTAPSEDK